MAQRRHALWLDIRRSIRHSMGRFLSIVGLMALGSFALVGLFVTGPDMRATGRAYFDALDAADILGGAEVDGGILWCVTELVSKAQLDKAVSIVKEVLK